MRFCAEQGTQVGTGALSSQGLSVEGPEEARGPRCQRQGPPYLWCLRPQWWCWCSLKIPARENQREQGGGEAGGRQGRGQWGLPGCLTLRPSFHTPRWLCHPDAPLKPCQTSRPKEGKGPAKQVAGGRRPERGWRMDAGRTLAFLEELGGVPGCRGAERHMVATEWGRNTHVGRRGRKREREAQGERAGLSRGRKTTQLRETAMEPEEEGHGPTCHHWNVETEAGAGGSSATGRPCVALLKKGLHGAPALAKPSPPPSPQLAPTEP